MNERIKELHNLACRMDMEQHPDAIPDGERIQQKFAELIVQDNIRILRSNGYDDAAQCLQDIHFGIEDPI